VAKINQLLTGSVVYNQATGKNDDTLAGFRAARNVEEFVNSNSDVPYDSSYVAKRLYQPLMLMHYMLEVKFMALMFLETTTVFLNLWVKIRCEC
jgi:hypothetical protein